MKTLVEGMKVKDVETQELYEVAEKLVGDMFLLVNVEDQDDALVLIDYQIIEKFVAEDDEVLMREESEDE